MKLDITDRDYRSKVLALDALHQVADPELGINIVDLGLVYAIAIDQTTKEVLVDMTLSTRSCPLGSFITNHAKIAIETAMPGYTANVNLVWDPKWNADLISDQGKAELGW